jgi:hypothetical protein
MSEIPSRPPVVLTFGDLERLTEGHHNCHTGNCGCNCGMSYDQNWQDIISRFGRNHPPCKCKPETSKTVWQCEHCGTIYAEYVNGCPHCWDVGLRSKVVGRERKQDGARML